MKSLLFSLLLNLLLELLILVSVSHLGWHYLSLLLYPSSATVVPLALVAWLLMRLVWLSHHMVLLWLFLTILPFILFILLVTDIPMGIILLLLEIGCLALVLRRLGVHWVSAALDFGALDAKFARVHNRHAIACRALSHVTFIATSALGLDLQLGFLRALGVPAMVLLLEGIAVSLSHVLASIRVEGETLIVAVIISHCFRLIKILLVFHMNLLGVHFYINFNFEKFE